MRLWLGGGKLVKVVLMEDFWLAYAGAYDFSFNDGLNGEEAREAGTVCQVDLECSSVSGVLENAKRLDGFS
jgi:hypothetical protein